MVDERVPFVLPAVVFASEAAAHGLSNFSALVALALAPAIADVGIGWSSTTGCRD
jgi:hypothetical protein